MMKWLSSLAKPYLDFTLSSPRGYRTRIIEKPGEWMSDEQIAEIQNHLKSVVNTLDIGSLDYGLLEGGREKLKQGIITLIFNETTGKPVAFNALTVMNCHLRGKPQQVIHLGLVVIDPSERAKGFSWILYGLTIVLLFIKNRCAPFWISNVTQVPAIIGSVSENFSSVYPNPWIETRRSFDHLILAREIMQSYRHVFGVGRDAQFDEERFIITNAYTGGSDALKKSFEQAPKHRRPIFNEYAMKELNYDRGDDVLQLGVMDLKSYYNYLAHAVPAGSLLLLLYKALFMFLERSLVPIFQWLTPSKPMGVLRARK